MKANVSKAQFHRWVVVLEVDSNKDPGVWNWDDLVGQEVNVQVTYKTTLPTLASLDEEGAKP